ncbi:MAG: DNA starvation/stationary phase protection protein [Spirochaetaceae bacterium]|nr:DNA starvation/stationary phase protection protein [Spirochaetaceae bacterium]
MQKELVNKLNTYISNIGVSYIKLHNLHWNLKGSQFKAVHEYLETLYDSFADILDEVAELLRMNEYIPVASMKEFLSLAIIKELDGTIQDTKTALEIVLSDMKLLKKEAEGIRILALNDDSFCTSNMMEDNITAYNKNIWFIHSMLS